MEQEGGPAMFDIGANRYLNLVGGRGNTEHMLGYVLRTAKRSSR